MLKKTLGLAAALFVLLGAALPATVRAADAGAGAPPETSATSYIVMDAATGQVLVAKNADARAYPASITKIMTMALVLERLGEDGDTGAMVTVSDAAVDALIPRATMVALGRGEEASVRDLLYATKIESANDAAHALGEYSAGSMEAFAEAMTLRAKGLGLSNSQFTNSSGQPADGHYTTAYDMAEITRWALSVPGFRELFEATRYSMAPTNMQPAGREFHNSNMAMAPGSRYYVEGVTGSKTGYTDQARYTLATTARRGDTELICVVMNCSYNESKYTDTSALLDYCFNNFRRVAYDPGVSANCRVPVYGGGQEPLGEIDVLAESTVSFLLHNSLSEDVVLANAEVPERYLIGQAFAPSVTLSLPDGMPQQRGGQLASLPLTWRGLEEVLAANPNALAEHRALTRGSEEQLPWFWVALATAASLLMVTFPMARRTHRKRLRARRLAEAAAQLPVRVAERPIISSHPNPRTMRVDFRRPVSTPAMRAANYGGSYGSPRRAGQVR